MTHPQLDSSLDFEITLRKQPNTAPDAEEFIHLVSHDLRGSIRALLELPEWIAEDIEESGLEVSPSVHSSVALMKRHTQRLDRMLFDLLQYSRAGKMANIREVSLQETFDAVIKEIGPTSGFRIDHSFGCGSFLIDEGDLHTLLSALIENAIKHHDKFSGRVAVAAWREGSALMVTVSDDGPGIHPRFHERVFKPMTTLRSRDEVEGSGLGLALVQKIAGNYGGHARLISTGAERGTSVEVRLEGAI